MGNVEVGSAGGPHTPGVHAAGSRLSALPETLAPPGETKQKARLLQHRRPIAPRQPKGRGNRDGTGTDTGSLE